MENSKLETADHQDKTIYGSGFSAQWIKDGLFQLLLFFFTSKPGMDIGMMKAEDYLISKARYK